MLRLPDSIRGCLFDLDGVLTQTATVHATAWKEMFDAFLEEQAAALRQRGADIVVCDLAELLDGE